MSTKLNDLSQLLLAHRNLDLRVAALKIEIMSDVEPKQEQHWSELEKAQDVLEKALAKVDALKADITKIYEEHPKRAAHKELIVQREALAAEIAKVRG